jgi:hypothetical protein
METLAPLRRGFFHAGPPRSAQPTARLGVGVVGLLRTGEISKPVYGNTYDPPSPAPLAGLLFGRPSPSAGPLRMPVGCPVLTQRRGLRRYFLRAGTADNSAGEFPAFAGLIG